MEALETPRLLLRPFADGDFAALRAVLGDPRVMYAWEHGFDDGEVRDWISRNQTRYAAEGTGYLAAVERATGELVGSVGLVRERILDARPLCLGYILRRDRWGRGLAVEGAAACADHAFGALGQAELWADIRPENVASRRVARRLGMVETGWFEKPYRDKLLPHLIYVLEREAFERLRKGICHGITS